MTPGSDPWAATQEECTSLRDQVAQLTQALHQAREQNALLHAFYSLVHNAPDAIVVTDLAGVVTYANPAFKALYGYGDASIGMHIPQFFPVAEHENLDQLLQTLRTLGFWHGTIMNQRKNGTLFLSQESAMLITNQANVPQALAAIVRDITHAHPATSPGYNKQEE